jgi:ABC-type multidrug transport system fused ATPase/permease subunit
VRSNVDPNGDYKDDEIWIALGKARLEEKVRGLPGDLDYAGKTQRALFSAVCFTEMIVLSR